MPLIPCRACSHPVDTSALACPRCGATDPARKISRQQREARNSLIQAVMWTLLLAFAGWHVVHSLIPWARALLIRPTVEQTHQNPSP